MEGHLELLKACMKESPGILEESIKAILRPFVAKALDDPAFVLSAIKNEAILCVMRQKPAGLEKVSGDVILPLLQQVIIELAPHLFVTPSAPPLPAWKRMYELIRKRIYGAS